MTKKILAMFLAVLMVVSVMSTSVLAQEASDGEQTYYCPAKDGLKHTQDNCETYDDTAENEAYRPVVVEPTCTKEGYTLVTCKGCNEQFPIKETEKAPHNYVTVAEDQVATCEKPGYKAGAEVCSVCGAVKNESDKIDALGHDWKLTGSDDCESSEDGKLHYACSRCDKTKETEITDKQHKWNWTLTKPATDKENGSAHGVCANCGKETDIVVFYNHNCADAIYKVDEVAATCTTDGVKVHYACAVCNKKYSDAEAKTAATDASLKIAKTGHVPYTEVNCANDGETVYCKYCHEKYTWKQAHKWENVDHESNKAATCTVNGNQHQKCSVCEAEQDVVIPAAHKYAEDKYKAPTCTEKGSKTEVCSACGDEKVSEIAATGHKLYTVTIPSTCTIAGYEYQICVNENCPLESVTEWKVGSVKYDLTNVSVLNMYCLKDSATHYFTGKMSGFYGATSTNINDAVQIYTESVILLQETKQLDKIATRLYFIDDNGVKQYIGMKASLKDKENPSKGYYYNFVFNSNTNAEGVIFDFDWDETYGVYTVTANDTTKLFMGAYKNTNFGFVNYDYVANKDDYKGYVGVKLSGVKLYVEKDEKGNVTNTPVTVLEKNPDGHVFSLTRETLPTCTEDGSAVICCIYGCGEIRTLTEGYEAKGHDLYTSGHTRTVIEYACRRTGCSHTETQAYTDGAANSIHVWNDGEWVPAKGTDGEMHDVPNHLCHEMDKVYTCTECEITKTERKHWEHCADWKYIYENIEAAKAEHGELTYKGVSEVGTCYQKEVQQWQCADCNQWIKVYNDTDENGNKYGQHVWGVATEGPLKGATIGGSATVLLGSYETEVVWVAPATGTYKVSIVDADGKIIPVAEWIDANWGDPLWTFCDEETYNNWGDPTAAPEEITVVAGETYYFSSQFEVNVVLTLTSKISLAPTCKEEGYNYLSACTREGCDCYSKDAGKYEKLDKVDHNYVANSNFKCPGAAGYKLPENFAEMTEDEQKAWFLENNLYYEKCEWCDECHYYIPAVIDKKKAEKLCSEYSYYIYKCNCGQIHALYFYGNYGHKDYIVEHEAPTCAATGKDTYNCYFCGNNKSEKTLDRLPHVNSIGQAFVCVGNDNYEAKDIYGNKLESTVCVNACCKNLTEDEKTLLFHNWKWQGHWDATCTDRAFDLYVCECGLEHYDWHGEKAHHTIPVDKDGKEIYTKVDPTATSVGYIKYTCAICGKEIIEEMSGPVISIENNNGDKSGEYTLGSLIKVTLSMNNMKELTKDVWGYELGFYFDSDYVRYVGFENLNDKFIVSSMDPVIANEESWMCLTGYAENTAEGKIQGIELDANAPLVNLYFRVIANENEQTALGAYYLGIIDSKKNENVLLSTKNVNEIMGEVIDLRILMDVNKTSIELPYVEMPVTLADLQAAVALLTGERADNVTYDVTADLDGDGEITANDILLFAEVYNGNVTYREYLRSLISDEEAKILGYEFYHCAHEGCDYESEEEFKFCPECGTPYELLH